MNRCHAKDIRKECLANCCWRIPWLSKQLALPEHQVWEALSNWSLVLKLYRLIHMFLLLVSWLSCYEQVRFLPRESSQPISPKSPMSMINSRKLMHPFWSIPLSLGTTKKGSQNNYTKKKSSSSEFEIVRQSFSFVVKSQCKCWSKNEVREVDLSLCQKLGDLMGKLCWRKLHQLERSVHWLKGYSLDRGFALKYPRFIWFSPYGKNQTFISLFSLKNSLRRASNYKLLQVLSKKSDVTHLLQVQSEARENE